MESGKEEEISILNESRESLFDFLKKVGSTINNRSEISGVLDYIVDTAVRSTSADAGVILLSEESEHSMNVKAVAGDYPPPYKIGEIIKVRISSVREYFKNVPVKIGESVLGEAAQTGEPIYIMDTTDDERMQYNTKYDIQYISSIIVTPLVIDNKIFGVLSIIKKKRNSFLTEQEFEKICSFAEYTSLTLDNMFTYLEVLEKREIDREVGIAADIQKRLLPQKFQNIPNTAISVISVPARGVSGDYYDVIMHKDGKVSVLICDVAGKGVPASLVMVMIRSIVHLIIGRIKGAEKVLNWVNTGIYGSVEIEHYATMSLFTYNPGNGGMEYSNAGHHPFMIYRKQTNKIETMDTEGLPVGIEPS
ncbi:MAG: SpoIIE family protein phosphatase, partial [Spirochaetales bacterium]|nr:SpoIIE family protein phosphatase [Spirochaetales bacterium]